MESSPHSIIDRNEMSSQDILEFNMLKRKSKLVFNSESLKVMTNWCWNWYHISPVSWWDATSEAQLHILFPSFILLSMQLQWARSTILYAIPCKGTTIWTPVSQRYVDFPPSNYWGRSCLNSSYNDVLINILMQWCISILLVLPHNQLIWNLNLQKIWKAFSVTEAKRCASPTVIILIAFGCHG